ncbi:MAG: hypothetical protein K9L88_13420 [Chromatiaceae bacterium]|nr:hypothetical protein [Chromatiaceae bacterium]MCF8014316.1 hypothetical protein [Chromatiaceae bacterium]
MVQDDPAFTRLLSRAARLPAGLSPEERLKRLWTTPDLYHSHVRRRLSYGHIASERELAQNAFDALAQAQHGRISRGAFPVLEIENGKWSIILDQDGRIKTVYPIEPGRPSFSDNQRRLGHQVDDIDLSQRVLASFTRLFGTY